MKKILFTTTALVAATVIAGAAEAQTKSTRYLQQNDMMGASAFKATVGGYANWMVGYASNDKDAGKNEFDVMGDAEVHFDFAATLKNGLKIGATAQLTTDTSVTEATIDETYMYVESMYGKVMVGRHVNVNEQLALHAVDLGALDIQESDLTNWIIPTFVAPATALNSEATATYFTTDSKYTKLSYITPNFSGFQAGVTYAPRGGDTKTSVAYPAITDATILTAAYNATVDGVGFGVSAGYGVNSVVGETVDKWNVGARVAYKGFTVSAALKDVDAGASDNLTVWDAGVTYEQGPYGVSLSYLAADQGSLSTSTLLLSGVYNMAAGVDAFATIGMGDYELAAGDANKNDGFAVIGGMMLSF